jgi:ABC-2 type transport system ATP-binding protein
MIQVKNLVKRYADLTAVDNISFTVKKGDIVGLLGPKGAGMTTTLRILTCFMPATSGEATVDGFDVFSQSLEVRRRIGYMPEHVPLYPEMRVIEYLRFRGKLKGLRGNLLRDRLETVIDGCQLGEVRTRIIEQLSKGNRQRVAMAEALISDPELLILDEPTIGLDPNQVRKVRDLIKEIGRDRTVVLSTHILSEVEMVCDRVIIMHQGHIAAEDSMKNLRGESTRQYICEVKASAADAEKLLSQIAGATELTATQESSWARVVMSSADGKTDLRVAIYNAVRDKGWSMRLLETKVPSLEDVFVKITAK